MGLDERYTDLLALRSARVAQKLGPGSRVGILPLRELHRACMRCSKVLWVALVDEPRQAEAVLRAASKYRSVVGIGLWPRDADEVQLRRRWEPGAWFEKIRTAAESQPNSVPFTLHLQEPESGADAVAIAAWLRNGAEAGFGSIGIECSRWAQFEDAARESGLFEAVADTASSISVRCDGGTGRNDAEQTVERMVEQGMQVHSLLSAAERAPEWFEDLCGRLELGGGVFFARPVLPEQVAEFARLLLMPVERPSDEDAGSEVLEATAYAFAVEIIEQLGLAGSLPAVAEALREEMRQQ